MEQRINENFNEKLNEGIGQLERMMYEMNQSRRRVSPESSHGGNRVSPPLDQERREDHDRINVDDRDRNVDDRNRRDVDDRDRRNVDQRNVGGRNGGRDIGGHERHRYASDFDE